VDCRTATVETDWTYYDARGYAGTQATQAT